MCKTLKRTVAQLLLQSRSYCIV